jgi:hypothetical protein
MEAQMWGGTVMVIFDPRAGVRVAIPTMPQTPLVPRLT